LACLHLARIIYPKSGHALSCGRSTGKSSIKRGLPAQVKTETPAPLQPSLPNRKDVISGLRAPARARQQYYVDEKNGSSRRIPLPKASTPSVWRLVRARVYPSPPARPSLLHGSHDRSTTLQRPTMFGPERPWSVVGPSMVRRWCGEAPGSREAGPTPATFWPLGRGQEVPGGGTRCARRGERRGYLQEGLGCAEIPAGRLSSLPIGLDRPYLDPFS